MIYALGPAHPQGNPRHYKYTWQIFSDACPWEEGDFFAHAPVLSYTDYVTEVERLYALGKTCIVYGIHRPRKDPSNPWDLNSPRWHNVEFAVSWEEDPDPVVLGGHK